jgi:hypothetical protein
MKPEVSLQILENYSNIKFHENPFFGNRVVSWTKGWTEERTDKDTDMMKLIVDFRNFANDPNNCLLKSEAVEASGRNASP